MPSFLMGASLALKKLHEYISEKPHRDHKIPPEALSSAFPGAWDLFFFFGWKYRIKTGQGRLLVSKAF